MSKIEKMVCKYCGKELKTEKSREYNIGKNLDGEDLIAKMPPSPNCNYCGEYDERLDKDVIDGRKWITEQEKKGINGLTLEDYSEYINNLIEEEIFKEMGEEWIKEQAENGAKGLTLEDYKNRIKGG